MVRVVKKPEERKEEIVLAACQLFLAKGYENTTMRDVMTGIGIAKGTIYHYFKSKEELLDAVIEHIACEQFARQRSLLEQISGNGLQRIRQFVMLITQHDQENAEVIAHLHKPANAGMHIRILARHIILQAPLHESMIRQGCEEGIFSTATPREAAEFILAGIRFLTDMGVHPWSDEQLTRRVKAFPTMIESMLGAPPGSFDFLLQMLH